MQKNGECDADYKDNQQSICIILYLYLLLVFYIYFYTYKYLLSIHNMKQVTNFL